MVAMQYGEDGEEDGEVDDDDDDDMVGFMGESRRPHCDRCLTQLCPLAPQKRA